MLSSLRKERAFELSPMTFRSILAIFANPWSARMKRATFTLVVLIFSASTLFAYTKPNTYRPAKIVCTNPLDPSTCSVIPEAIVFQSQAPLSPHSWVIPKAIELLRTDGFQSEADLADKYLLPMLEGVTFNDVWGRC
jgi:hypothetical protein